MCFAPDGNQEETYDHATKAVEKNEVRDMAAESSRISRVPVRKLNTLKADAYHALIIPGGFGVAKNLSNYAEDSTVCFFYFAAHFVHPSTLVHTKIHYILLTRCLVMNGKYQFIEL